MAGTLQVCGAAMEMRWWPAVPAAMVRNADEEDGVRGGAVAWCRFRRSVAGGEAVVRDSGCSRSRKRLREGAVEMEVEDGWWLPWLRRNGGRKTSFHGG